MAISGDLLQNGQNKYKGSAKRRPKKYFNECYNFISTKRQIIKPTNKRLKWHPFSSGPNNKETNKKTMGVVLICTWNIKQGHQVYASPTAAGTVSDMEFIHMVQEVLFSLLCPRCTCPKYIGPLHCPKHRADVHPYQDCSLLVEQGWQREDVVTPYSSLCSFHPNQGEIDPIRSFQ